MVITRLNHALPILRLHNSDRDWFSFVPLDTEGGWWVVSHDSPDAPHALRSRNYFMRAGPLDTEDQARAEITKLDNHDGIEWYIAHGNMEPC